MVSEKHQNSNSGHTTPITIFISFPVTSSTATLNLKLWDVLNNRNRRFGEPGWRRLWLREYAMLLPTTHSLEKYKTVDLKILSLFLYQDSLSIQSWKKWSTHNGNFLKITVHLSQFDIFLAECWAKEGSVKRSQTSSLSLSVGRTCPQNGLQGLSVIVSMLRLMKYFLSGFIPHLTFLIFDLLMVIAHYVGFKGQIHKKGSISTNWALL